MPVLKALLAAASIIPLASASPTNATMNNGMPPERFRGNSVSIVVFTDEEGVSKMCGTAPPGFRIVACKRNFANGAPIVIMPNPCPLGDVEFYARILCHENGHVNGWTGEHEE